MKRKTLKSSNAVFDASAVLAYVRNEPGGDVVGREFGGATISAANWVEVLEKALPLGVVPAVLLADVEALGARVVPVEVGQTEFAARLHAPTRPQGLSLADRLCLALAAEHRAPVLTADRSWSEVDAGVEVRLIR